MEANTATPSPRRFQLSHITQEQIVLAVTALLFIGLSIFLEGFFSSGNLFSLLRSVSVLGILSLGMAIVVIGRGLDLSQIGVMAIGSGWVLLLMSDGMATWKAVLLGLAASLAIGLINGIVVTFIELPPLFATLASGMLSMEIIALTAVVLGGVSLGGGKGSVGRAIIGTTTVLVLNNGVVRYGVSGGMSSAVLGFTLLLAVAIDVRWNKNKHKAISTLYVVPTYLNLPQPISTTEGPAAVNERLRAAEAIGLDQIDGPEDVIFDRQGRIYGGVRQGWIVRFSGPNYETREVFARPGGRPLGMAFDKDENLVVCIGGMGLYGIKPDGTVFKMTDETNRSWNKINDDSRLRLADDCDIAPDGKVYFSEATIRYEMHSWATDALEGRGNGRLICYDPKTKKTSTVIKDITFPNGVCVAHDGKSVLFAQTWLCRIMRYWLEGPKKGQMEVMVDRLPGYPDNINRASDGSYWLALVGMRTPTFDLAMRKPDFRTRLVRQIAPDEWIYPNINNGCILKFNEAGSVTESLWDPGGKNHPTITSMREHQGYLYIGGLYNNRIGRVKLEGADPTWTSQDSYWGKK